ncbi:MULTISPECIES: NAD(P)H-dependent oxidoreductase [Anaerococcus]|uniref:NAD(P)H-dependent oxidoreductase n=3 Tax=Peptoniphilaceae TaxID=1570339 RepID=UPI001AE136CE|nr:MULTISPECIES: NAD(P)-binding domain-containing protein [Anaerococcus]MBP2069919.1 putative homoserine dehydrogenase-like protein [Anaerococcus nagyae]MDU1863819.1 NAD(P)-binding domain-containing protein [Anaerococcus sp.]MDU2566223.1 NAD(P)-binding domain-containing protein [Anaerococcus sp.]MDU3211480.1 NAD(P)-binding domain-containing protein [Anaerococcus sp.]
MFKISRNLNEMKYNGESIKLAIIGAGKMGASLISQLSNIDAMEVKLVIDRTPQKAIDALKKAGIPEERIIYTDDYNEGYEVLEKGYVCVSTNYRLSYKLLQINAVIDCTGNPSFGAVIARKTIQYHKHMISFNVECEATVGPVLHDMAKKAGVVYTGILGDEPGAIIDLCDQAFGMGLDVLVAAKGKNNKLDEYATPETLKEEAKGKNLSAKMLTSFVDGTNTMLELNSVCNALGFLPDTFGCHGIDTSPETAVEDFKLKREGGILDNYKIVEFSKGMAPGVFIIATSDKEDVRDLMKFLGFGDGPNYLMYRPYHLTSLEAPITIYNAVVENEPTIAPIQGQVADTITIAKRDIKAGESLDGIGSEKVYGKLTSHTRSMNEDLLPIGLITPKTVATCDIPKDTLIEMNMVEIDERATITRLRRRQNSMKL